MTMLHLIVRLLLCGLIMPTCLSVRQAVTLSQTEVRTIQSKTFNGETCQLLVHFPDDYDPVKRYDVLYVLDRLDSFPMVISCRGILHGECDKNYKAHKDLPRSVWLSVGQNDEYLVEDAQKLTDVQKSRSIHRYGFSRLSSRMSTT